MFRGFSHGWTTFTAKAASKVGFFGISHIVEIVAIVLRDACAKLTNIFVWRQLRKFSEQPVSVLEEPIFMSFVEVVPILVSTDLISICKKS